jgi:trans-2,3-dihydro-3-hydroxyanthranilate isomerase
LRRAFYTLDVFTNTRFAGNPLAVVTDCEGLSASQMQAIAQEFNLSETVFVLDPLDPVNTARLRIFTPARELPFAGHPTVGAAVLIGELRAPEMLGGQGLGLVLQERIGLISCTVRRPKLQATQASFLLPSLPECLVETLDAGAVAAALGLKAADIGFDAHRPSVWSAGDPFTFVPVASIQAIRRASPNLALFPSTFSGARPAAFLYTKDVVREGSHVHARMFAPGSGIMEDPATGSAAAAFAGVAALFEQPEDGDHLVVIEQGFEMARPSIMHLRIQIDGGALVGASLGGSAVLVSQGTIEA